MAIGSKRFTTFFRLLGFVGQEVESREQLIKKLEEVHNRYAIVVVDRSIAFGLERYIDELSMEWEAPIMLLDPPYEVKETAEAVEREITRAMKVF